MRDLSRLPERSMCGFSKLVASEVTQPLWPSSVPRITNCSPMLGRWGSRNEYELGMPRFQVLVRLASCSSSANSRSNVGYDCSQGKKLRQLICGPKFKRVLQLIFSFSAFRHIPDYAYSRLLSALASHIHDLTERWPTGLFHSKIFSGLPTFLPRIRRVLLAE